MLISVGSSVVTKAEKLIDGGGGVAIVAIIAAHKDTRPQGPLVASGIRTHGLPHAITLLLFSLLHQQAAAEQRAGSSTASPSAQRSEYTCMCALCQVCDNNIGASPSAPRLSQRVGPQPSLVQ